VQDAPYFVNSIHKSLDQPQSPGKSDKIAPAPNCPEIPVVSKGQRNTKVEFDLQEPASFWRPVAVDTARTR
jgi:hypothetical protein